MAVHLTSCKTPQCHFLNRILSNPSLKLFSSILLRSATSLLPGITIYVLYCSSLVLTALYRLNEMGLKVAPPDATFYIWVNCISTSKVQTSNLVSELPETIHSGLSFFEACLEEKVIIVPGMCHNSDADSKLGLGLFFDINPKNRRDLSHSPCHHFIRYNSTLLGINLCIVSPSVPRWKNWRGVSRESNEFL